MAVAAADQIVVLLPTKMIFTSTSVDFTADVTTDTTSCFVGKGTLLPLLLNWSSPAERGAGGSCVAVPTVSPHFCSTAASFPSRSTKPFHKVRVFCTGII